MRTSRVLFVSLTVVMLFFAAFLAPARAEPRSNLETNASNDKNLESLLNQIVPKHVASVILKRAAFEKEGFRLEELGDYDGAIKKYQEALAPENIQEESDKCFAMGGIADCYYKQGKYEEALKIMDWFMSLNPKKAEYIERKMELQALIRARDTNSHVPIYEFISYLRTKHKNHMPPRGYDTSRSSTILYLYDHMGDMDGGIKFSTEAIRYFEKKGYSTQEYWEMRRAFEADKKAGAKGRATKILMRSKYFFW